jgi:hypothetical protein
VEKIEAAGGTITRLREPSSARSGTRRRHPPPRSPRPKRGHQEPEEAAEPVAADEEETE